MTTHFDEWKEPLKRVQASEMTPGLMLGSKLAPGRV